MSPGERERGGALVKVRIPVCEHTGLVQPECHCRACLRALIERHAPSHRPAEAAPPAGR